MQDNQPLTLKTVERKTSVSREAMSETFKETYNITTFTNEKVFGETLPDIDKMAEEYDAKCFNCNTQKNNKTWKIIGN